MTPPQVNPARFIVDGPENPATTQLCVEWNDNLQEVRFRFSRDEVANLKHYADEGLIQILKDIPLENSTSANVISIPIRDRQQLHALCSQLTSFAVALALNASITVDHNQ